MKKIIRGVCAILVFVVVFSSTAFAAPVEDPRASSYFVATSANLKKTSGGFEIWLDVTATGTMDQLGASTVVVERSSNGSSWSPVKTFTKASYPEMVGTGTAFHTCCLTYTASVGYYYRAIVTFYAKKGTGIGEYPHYSSSLKL